MKVNCKKFNYILKFYDNSTIYCFKPFQVNSLRGVLPPFCWARKQIPQKLVFGGYDYFCSQRGDATF